MIDLDPDDACAPEAALFANADWRVLADGLEHTGTGYFVARETIAMRRQGALWEWPLHLSEKTWCSLRPFREAFLAALDAFGIVRDPALAQSFAIGFGLNAGQGAARASDEFVALADMVRPVSASKPLARKRPSTADARIAARRGGSPNGPVPQRAGQTAHHSAAL
ncbi:hypothetical protein G3T14_08700 [Methylobacterium sp. BTF04]|uniref:hypothetical protein n=1 Tax=Methylobacterium sp. BTF04 TaxID=2708300 RepID=UPI0013D211CF|nr:hypothetical protein [Methylobacterium sp. BTF04]NEU12211.1 hypothetical protein [Methylobacterium sp. BTF04]